MCFFSFLVESKISLSKLWAEARVGNEFWSCPCCLGKLIGFVRLSYLGKELWTLVHQIVDSIHELWDETCMLIGYHMGDHYLTTLSSKKSSTRISVPHHIQKNEKKKQNKKQLAIEKADEPFWKPVDDQIFFSLPQVLLNVTVIWLWDSQKPSSITQRDDWYWYLNKKKIEKKN